MMFLRFLQMSLLMKHRILVDKAFEREWFNTKYHLLLKRSELTTLLNLAVKTSCFNSTDMQLYEQVDGVGMGSPLGPLMANVFMCSIKKDLEEASIKCRHFTIVLLMIQ